jgi:hypothetical protein
MKISLLSILMLVQLTCFAQVDVIDLYSGEIPVQTQDARERSRALPGALAQVLTKFSGLTDLETIEGTGDALRTASQLVVSFHYRDVVMQLADGSSINELRLVVRFSRPDVDAMRQELQLPLWQPERDPLTVWVVVDSGLSRQIMPLEYTYIRESMTHAARARGLPVKWPAPDEFGEYPVDVQLLWGGYIEDIAGPEDGSILLATARREGAQWNVRMNLAVDDGLWNWRTQSLELESALVDGIHMAVDEIARANSIVATDQGLRLHEIIIRGVTGEQDYVRCLNYLEGLSVVDQVAVRLARPGRVGFVLKLNALPSYFEQAVNDGGVLEIDDDDNHFRLVHQFPGVR